MVFAMVGLSHPAQAHGYSQATVRSAQQQLKDSGYYTGTVDGIDGPATRAAIRKYQSANSLTVNGQLDSETCDKLGIQTGATSGSENRMNTPSSTSNMNAPSSVTVLAAQRMLKQKGFYKGPIDGNIDSSETQAAIREFQKNSNLNVTGQLDQGTLSSLGVSK
jgi:peptidoglycan DL-endopeptidase LytE